MKTSYGDTTLGGSLTQSNIITGAGELNIRNAGDADGEHLIGHYNSASVTANQKTNFIGILILEGTTTRPNMTDFRYTTVLYDAAGVEYPSSPNRIAVPYVSGGNPIFYKFDYNWNPANSTLTTHILDTGGNPVSTNTMTLASNPAFSVNAFGLQSGLNSDDPAAPLSHEIYIDAVTYSVVPEPASLGLLAAGAGLVLRRRRI